MKPAMGIRRFGRVAVAAASALLSLAAVAGGRLSDFWVQPGEPGWGMSVVQQGDTAFVALFVYGQDGQPRWYVASRAELVAVSAVGELPTFEGALYRTTGSWNGVAYDPSRFGTTPVGRIRLETLTPSNVHVQYSTEDATAVKDVTRLTFAPLPLAGLYDGTLRLQELSASDEPVGTLVLSAQMSLEVNADAAQLTVLDNLQRTCVYRGALSQSGAFANLGGTFTCSGRNGPDEAGLFEIRELEATAHGITGFLRSASPLAIHAGRFAAAKF